MRKIFRKRYIYALVALVLCFAIYKAFSISQAANDALARERLRLAEKAKVPFDKKLLTPHLEQDVQIIQNTRDVRALVDFHDSYFAATSGGLMQISDDKNVIRHFTVLDGLPESDLTSLAVYANRLFIGTQTKGLVTFDGEKFEGYTWPDRHPQAITALLPDGRELLIGTFNGGLLRFDGTNFTEIKADSERLPAVDCLMKDGPSLYVGTFNNGLHIYENDIWRQLTTADGLPSNRIVGISVKDGKLYAATDFGLAVLEDQAFKSVVTMPSLSSMTTRSGQLLLAKDNGEIYTFDAKLKQIIPNGEIRNARLASTAGKTWLLSNDGIKEIDGGRLKQTAKPAAYELTDNFVSSLAFDEDGSLWVGTFQYGIDVLSADRGKIRHLQTDDLREINFLQEENSTIRSATTHGIATIGKDSSVTRTLTRTDGLPSNSINDFSGNAIATAKGLVFQDKDKFNVLSTVQGLPSNSIYTLLRVGERLYAGTLGGLAVIEDRRVTRTYKDSNSNLNTNWVTALCSAGDRLFIGTYGGGVFELLPSGEVRSFEPETGKFVVNVNAMFSDDEHLFVGTLDGAKVLNLQTQEWRSQRSLLPSEIVTSITGTSSAIYFGTTSGIGKFDKSYFASSEKR